MLPDDRLKRMKGLWSYCVCTSKGQICILPIASSAKKVPLWATEYADIWVQVKIMIISSRSSTIKPKLIEAGFGQVPWWEGWDTTHPDKTMQLNTSRIKISLKNSGCSDKATMMVFTSVTPFPWKLQFFPSAKQPKLCTLDTFWLTF